jgi:formylmethanofuran dehydrogenase subunit D
MRPAGIQNLYHISKQVSIMTDLKLIVKKRAFPSHGRVRIHESRLTGLKIAEGDQVDLINEITGKIVTVTVIADRMVGEGEVRVSEEDLKDLGLKEGSTVVVKKTPPLKEKIEKAAQDANKSLSESVGKIDSAVRKTGESVKVEATKTTASVKAETKKVADTVKTGAAKTATAVKSGTKKVADKAGKVADETSAAVKKHLKGKDEL